MYHFAEFNSLLIRYFDTVLNVFHVLSYRVAIIIP